MPFLSKDESADLFSGSHESGLQQSPVHLIGISIGLTALILVAVAISSWLSWRDYVRAVPMNRELELARESLQGSSGIAELAKEAAEQGPLSSLEEYYSFSTEITESIHRISEISDEPAISSLLPDLKQRHEQIVSIGVRAIELALSGEEAEAVTLLQGQEYFTALGAYDRIESRVVDAIDTKIDTDIATLEMRALGNLAVIGTSFPILTVLWISALVRVRRISRRRYALAAELRRMTHHDDLTGLLNRRGFMSLAEQQYRIARRTGRPLMIVFCDLDGLKPVNDRFGHEAGDEALKDTALILQRTFRDSDVVARLGGDEFVVLVLDADRRNEQVTLDRLDAALEEHNGKRQRPYGLSLSVGTATLDPQSGISLDELLTQADNAMYASKRHTRRSQPEPDKDTSDPDMVAHN